MRTSRPVLHDLERSRIEVILEVLAFAGIVFLVAMPAYYYPHLPDSIPRHFNLRGEPDGWSGKGGLLLTPVTCVVMYVSLTVVSRFPHIFNYPWPITEANARRQYTLSKQMMSAVKLNIVAIFSYITWGTIQTALGRQKGLSPSFAIISVPILFAILGLYLFKGSRAQ